MNNKLAALSSMPGIAKPNSILKVENLQKQYGGLLAVDVDYLEIQKEAITAIIGPNGAGKTTFFNLITGYVKPTSGIWSFKDTPLEKKLTHQISREGMVRTFQVTKTLDRLTVMENMLLSSNQQKGEKLLQSPFPFWKKQELVDIERASELLEKYGLIKMQNHYTSTLSGGQRKLLEMTRALMNEPDLILLDEPLAGVNPALIEKILGYMRELVKQGLTVVFIEHNMDAVVDVSDWVVCLAEGKVIAEALPTELINNQAVIDAYLS